MKKAIVGIIMILQVAVSLDLTTSNFGTTEEEKNTAMTASSCSTNNYIEVSDLNELETYILPSAE